MFAPNRRTCSGRTLVFAFAVALFGVRHAPADDTPPPAKLHPVLLQRLADEGDRAKAWVFFTDKGLHSADEVAATLRQVEATYDPRALERRRLRGDNAARGGALVDEHDIPVAQAYVDAVSSTGARVHVVSRWLNALSAYVTRAQAEQIAALPCVDRLEAVGRSRGVPPLPSGSIGVPPVADGEDSRIDYGQSAAQLQQINLPALHNEGYTGQGIIVGILDTGFKRTHVAFNQPGHPLNLIAEWDFINNDGNTGPEAGDPGSQHWHGSLILGCLGAYKPGSLVGGAYDAAFVLCKTEDTAGEYPAEEDNFVAGLEFTEFHGADMTTASLGYIDWYTQAQLDGQTAVTTIACNIHTANGVHHTNAAGNEYHDNNPAIAHLIAPADAFQVITCGAVNSSGSIASFSSDGPSADGRVKPEVLARGVSTYTIDPDADNSYTTASGTSLSTPLVACAVACLVNAHPYWTVDQLRDHLFRTSDYFTQYGTFDPLYIRGYGIINAYNASHLCPEAGTLVLDAPVYACESTVTAHVADCGLNLNPAVVEQVIVAIDSPLETGVEQITLTELGPDAAEFVGTINLSATNAAGVLWVTSGNTITVTYIDADNGQGGYNVPVAAIATVDCAAPLLTDVGVDNVGSVSATVSATADEPVQITVLYGLTCGALPQQATSTGYAAAPNVSLTGLTPDTRYWFAVQATDVAGNSAYFNNEGWCYSFRTASGPAALLTFDLSSNPGWPVQGQWAFGHPTGQGGSQHGYPDPNNGYTGGNVYGVNLTGDYSTTVGGPYYAKLGPMSLAQVSETSVRFRQWLNTDYQPYVYATLEVSPNGAAWTAVWDNGNSEIAENVWSLQQYDIAAIADGQTAVYIRWGYEVASGAWAYSGWNIDDVEIWGSVATTYFLGDMNCDGLVTFDDVDGFVLALYGPAVYYTEYPTCNWESADANNDGRVDFDDVNPFVALLGT